MHHLVVMLKFFPLFGLGQINDRLFQRLARCQVFDRWVARCLIQWSYHTLESALFALVSASSGHWVRARRVVPDSSDASKQVVTLAPTLFARDAALERFLLATSWQWFLCEVRRDRACIILGLFRGVSCKQVIGGLSEGFESTSVPVLLDLVFDGLFLSVEKIRIALDDLESLLGSLRWAVRDDRLSTLLLSRRTEAHNLAFASRCLALVKFVVDFLGLFLNKLLESVPTFEWLLSAVLWAVWRSWTIVIRIIATCSQDCSIGVHLCSELVLHNWFRVVSV